MPIRKAMPVILPAAVWLAITGYIQFLHMIPTWDLTKDENIEPTEIPWILAAFLLINALLQLLIVCTLTAVAAKKFHYGIKGLILSVPVLYLLFALYTLPSVYLFVDTDEWSGFFNRRAAMPSAEASVWITLQYGIVMLITAAACARKKRKEPSDG